MHGLTRDENSHHFDTRVRHFLKNCKVQSKDANHNHGILIIRPPKIVIRLLVRQLLLQIDDI